MEINAITLHVSDMARSVSFYDDLGFSLAYGGPNSTFTSLSIGANFVNLQYTGETPETGWGRVIFHVPSPDNIYDQALSKNHQPTFTPTDAEWGERYFHILDPDGHELSFSCKL